jgi:hypothetical protein
MGDGCNLSRFGDLGPNACFEFQTPVVRQGAKYPEMSMIKWVSPSA